MKTPDPIITNQSQSLQSSASLHNKRIPTTQIPKSIIEFYLFL